MLSIASDMAMRGFGPTHRIGSRPLANSLAGASSIASACHVGQNGAVAAHPARACMIIPSRVNTSIALDTSALSNVLASDATVDQFTETVLRRPVTIFVSTIVISEISSDGDRERALRMLQRFQRLCRKLGPRLCLALHHEELMRAELGRRLRGPPVHPRGLADLESARRGKLLEISQKFPESYERVQKTKEKFLESDREFHRFVAEQKVEITADSIVKLICASDPPRPTEMMVPYAASMSGGVFTAERIASDPRRFKAIHTIGHLAWRVCLANGVGPLMARTREQEQVLGTWRTKARQRGKGTWYDIFIAGAAAYVDLFVSDDDNQLRKCSFLAERNLLTFRSIKLSEFLG